MTLRLGENERIDTLMILSIIEYGDRIRTRQELLEYCSLYRSVSQFSEGCLFNCHLKKLAVAPLIF